MKIFFDLDGKAQHFEDEIVEWFCEFLVHFSISFQPLQVSDYKLSIEGFVNFVLEMPHNFVYTFFYFKIFRENLCKIHKAEGICLDVNK